MADLRRKPSGTRRTPRVADVPTVGNIYAARGRKHLRRAGRSAKYMAGGGELRASACVICCQTEVWHRTTLVRACVQEAASLD